MSTNSCACSASTDKFVYSFGGGSADGNGSMKNLLGGKGANLAEMARIGLPVPPGFTITTEVCRIARGKFPSRTASRMRVLLTRSPSRRMAGMAVTLNP